MALDWLGGRPPRFDAAWDHWRAGFVKGAIYGALFMGFILVAALVLRAPGAAALLEPSCASSRARSAARSLFPLARRSSAAPTERRRSSAGSEPPISIRARLRAASSRASALRSPIAPTLPPTTAACAFWRCSWSGRSATAASISPSTPGSSSRASGAKLQSWRLYALGVLLGGVVAGALGWYFDAPQLQVVIAKFWAYADVNYRLDGAALGDFTTYPIFNKYGMINLGEVAGGVRLFWAELVAGVINWSLAAPLFSINYVLLDAALAAKPAADQERSSARSGIEGLVEQGVRVLRWGLWMAPIINSFLRQSPDPTWYNQDGAVRSGVAIGSRRDPEPGRLPPIQSDACFLACSPTTGYAS